MPRLATRPAGRQTPGRRGRQAQNRPIGTAAAGIPSAGGLHTFRAPPGL